MSVTDAGWWRQAIVYEIYPRSFADADGDGIGDLEGIRSRVPYLRELGVDAVWLTPFYPSELADGGYDVANYRDIDPRIGTLEQFDALVADLHANGIRIFVDIVPNHSSDQHEWFKAALASPKGSRERARYIFRDGNAVDGELPPNDWPSHWGSTCWARTPDGQWYLHLFAPEQPDLNWDDPEVRADFLHTLSFWADRNVDGFCIDVAHGLLKDLSEPFPHVESLTPTSLPEDGTHPLLDRDGLPNIYASWRTVLDSYDPPRVMVGEVGASMRRRLRYTAPGKLHQAFNFELQEAPWEGKRFREVIERSIAFASESGSSTTWVLSNHDVVRHATRFGLPLGTDYNAWLLSDGLRPSLDKELGEQRARAAIMLMLALPGSVYLYQGEELGLFEVADLQVPDLQDPVWPRSDFKSKGRDGCRVPLPWSDAQPSFGFGSGAAHLPQPSWFTDFTVAKESADPHSVLSLYRRAIALRKELQSAEELKWTTSIADVLDFERPNGWRSVTNFGSMPQPLPAGKVLLSSTGDEVTVLAPNTTVWLLAH